MKEQGGPSTYRTLRTAFTLVWASGRGSVIGILIATAFTSAAVAGQLLIGRTVLDLLATGDTVDASELAPYLVVLGALLMASALSQAAATELRVPLADLADTIHAFPTAARVMGTLFVQVHRELEAGVATAGHTPD